MAVIIMLLLLSPAKKLLDFKQTYNENATQPLFGEKTAILIALLQQYSIDKLAKLMGISPMLARLTYNRFQAMNKGNPCYPAVLLFQGDVYQTLRAAEWTKTTLNYAQSHLLILSGLYGALRPLDAIEPYRLEMGTKLLNPCGLTLYDFWKDLVTEAINQHLKQLEVPVLVNLASAEYFKVVKLDQITYPVLTVHFMERKNNQLKTIGIQAKKARGAIASYILKNQITELEDIKGFNLLSYEFNSSLSTPTHFYFIR